MRSGARSDPEHERKVREAYERALQSYYQSMHKVPEQQQQQQQQQYRHAAEAAGADHLCCSSGDAAEDHSVSARTGAAAAAAVGVGVGGGSLRAVQRVSLSSSSSPSGVPPRPSCLPPTMPHLLHGGHYVIESRLGVGAYGTVYAGRSLHSGRAVAIKVESTSQQYPQLMIETETLLWLEDHGCGDIVPHVACKGRTERGDFLFTVMDRLGDNLLALLTRGGGRLSEGTVLKVAYQLVCIFEKLHAACIMHRDVKPENFCLRADDARTICVIDFGMSKAYKDPQTGVHIAPQTRHAFMGTPRYVSIHCHEGQQLSRRDDIISAGYVCAYLFLGSLPWRRLEEELNTSAGRSDPMRVYDRICSRKRDFPPSRLGSELGVPRAICRMIEHGYSLEFTQQPDYGALKALLLSDLSEHGGLAAHYDWELW